MKLLRRLFPASFSTKQPVSNNILANAIKAWNRNDSPGNYDKVVSILTGNDAVLVLPSAHSRIKQVRGESGPNTVLDLTATCEQNGVKTLMAFTSEDVMFEHTSKRNYVCLAARHVLNSCLDNNVKKVIVFSGRFEMFVQEWQES